MHYYFELQNGSEKRRQVQQFHFLVWPDKGVPRHATAVLGLRRKVRAKHTDNKAPLVVHCRYVTVTGCSRVDLLNGTTGKPIGFVNFVDRDREDVCSES